MGIFRICGLICTTILLAAMPAYAEDCKDENSFTSVTAGFSICKPEGWNFLTAEEVAANRAVARLKDEELEKQIRERANAPLVAIMRFPEPYDDLNPSIQVMFRPLGQLAGTPAVEVMKFVFGQLQGSFADFTFVEEIHETELGGQTAAHGRAKYTVANDEGREFPTLSRFWLICRGSFMFMISMSGPQEGPNVSEEEFEQVAASIVIQD
jgi:hypothetical protein